MPLSDAITTITGVGEKYASKLEKLGIITINDLFFHIPHRYLDFRNKQAINQITVGETVSIKGEVWQIENAYTRNRKKITIASINDDTGTIQLVWFNQTYLTKIIKQGDVIKAAGETTWWSKKPAIIAPHWEKQGEEGQSNWQDIVAIYPETEGITSKWLHKTIETAWESHMAQIEESIPAAIRTKNDLLQLRQALYQLHFPTDFHALDAARKRLAFGEMLDLQIEALKRRQKWNARPVPFSIDTSNSHINQSTNSLITSLPYSLTSAQQRVISEILDDLAREMPMNRLVQGDVGSGKTAVAAIAAYATFLSGFPTFLMAPTEVLAEQHYETFNTVLNDITIKIALVTGSTKTEAFEEADIVIGTHALFHQRKVLPQAGLVIIDELHKFGVEQRAKLIHYEGHKTPHILTMTATPIPRSIALTIYGDQDLSRIDEMPPGRKPVKTWLVPNSKRDNSYQWIEEQISHKPQTVSSKTSGLISYSLQPIAGSNQALIIYPLIDESESETMADVKAATNEFEILNSKFENLKVELLHGRLKSAEKNRIVEDFRNGTIDILISTSVVEVGIDAPNASIIVIENAERFGLATLHQLRGRVGRRGQQGYCFLFTPTDDELTHTRLKAMETHHDGLKLAEIDLELRGPGEVFGTRQHGVGELRFAKITDLDLIRNTRNAAMEIAQAINTP